MSDVPAPRARWKAVVFRHETLLLAVLVAEWCYFNAVGARFGTLDNTYDIVRHSVEFGLLALVMTWIPRVPCNWYSSIPVAPIVP